MAGPVTLQKFIEAALLLKLERGLRGLSSATVTGSAAPAPGPQAPVSSMPARMPEPKLERHVSHVRPFISPELVAPETGLNLAVALPASEASKAPMGYRDALQDGLMQRADMPDRPQPPPAINASAIQYAHPEIALALAKVVTLPITASERAAQQRLEARNGNNANRSADRWAQIWPIAVSAGCAVFSAALAAYIFR